MAEPAQDEASSAHPAETGLPIADPGIEAVPTAAGTAEETPSSAIQRLSAPIDPPPPRPPAPRQDRWLTAAWAASFAVLAGLGAAGYTQRDLMMRQWPASQMVYAKLGLTPVAPGSEQPPAH